MILVRLIVNLKLKNRLMDANHHLNLIYKDFLTKTLANLKIKYNSQLFMNIYCSKDLIKKR